MKIISLFFMLFRNILFNNNSNNNNNNNNNLFGYPYITMVLHPITKTYLNKIKL